MVGSSPGQLLAVFVKLVFAELKCVSQETLGLRCSDEQLQRQERLLLQDLKFMAGQGRCFHLLTEGPPVPGSTSSSRPPLPCRRRQGLELEQRQLACSTGENVSSPLPTPHRPRVATGPYVPMCKEAAKYIFCVLGDT